MPAVVRAGKALEGVKTGQKEILLFTDLTRVSWDGLSKEDQALIKKFAKEAQLEERQLWYDREKESLKKMVESGAVVNEVKDKKEFQAAVKPVWDKYGAQQQALIQRIQDVK